MADDDDIIIAGEEPVENSGESDSEVPRCDDCGSELEWTLTLDCIQKRVCPECS